VKTLRNPRETSGQHVIRHVLDLLNGRAGQVAFYWIPAHKGVPGNEADRLTKEATGWRAEGSVRARAQMFPLLQPLQFAVTRWARARAKEEWWKKWTGAEHGRLLRQLLPEARHYSCTRG
jgi:hypothetical protein